MAQAGSGKKETNTALKKSGAVKKSPPAKKTASKAGPKAKANGKEAQNGANAKKYKLVIVESPAKAKTIGKFLGADYRIKASNGHIMDLPKSKIGVDVDHNYEPNYIQIRGKSTLIKELKTEAGNADTVFLATDPDREGEAISWHIANMLNLDQKKAIRIEFNEITKNAVTSAIKTPRQINIDLVNAQQARRVLDRLVGYKLSPFLWRKVKKGLSAGRVQSVAVKIICDREKEIQDFIPKEFWTITALLNNQAKTAQFEAKYFGTNGKKKELNNEDEATAVLKDIDGKDFVVKKIKKGQKSRHASPPFTTSTMQQEASRKLGFTTGRTMLIAQQLYEGVEVAEHGSVGLVTYIRTDSTRISEEALVAVRENILKNYGKSYLPEKPNFYKSKKNAQDAHEAIRPTYMDYTPDYVKPYLSREQHKLYKLIYERFVASQMTSAVYDTMAVDLDAGEQNFKASGSLLVFKGYLAVYDNSSETDEEEEKTILPPLSEGEVCAPKEILPKQNFTQPPVRYTEASLVRMLEEKGIGRPSTYAPIISTIQERGYVKKDGKVLIPTDLGFVVNDIMKDNFKDIVNIEFTAGMEDKLDDIENGDKEWKSVLDEFYRPFETTLTKAESTVERVALPVVESDEVCEKCGAKMVYKEGRFGRFLACPNYPACKNTKAVVNAIDVPCPKCGGRVLVKRTKSKKTFYGCEKYPACDYVSWDMPLKDLCPKCGGSMVLSRIGNGKSYKKCINPECPSHAKKKKAEEQQVANEKS
jgi:DNA topoisomerase-1